MATAMATSLRCANLGALVVRLAEYGLWDPETDARTAVAALLAAPEATLHDVNCRRGLGAVLTGRHSTRAPPRYTKRN